MEFFVDWRILLSPLLQKITYSYMWEILSTKSKWSNPIYHNSFMHTKTKSLGEAVINAIHLNNFRVRELQRLGEDTEWNCSSNILSQCAILFMWFLLTWTILAYSKLQRVYVTVVSCIALQSHRWHNMYFALSHLIHKRCVSLEFSVCHRWPLKKSYIGFCCFTNKLLVNPLNWQWLGPVMNLSTCILVASVIRVFLL